MENASQYVIEMLHITKEFPGIKANDDITLQLKKGEIHALLGENGAGKSTLMSVLFGMYQPEEGEIRKNGTPVTIRDPNDATALGIGMVHQHFKLIDVFSVLDNIILGAEDTKLGFLQKKKARQKVSELSDRYGLRVDLDAKVEDITVGMQQRVEILKMLYRDVDLLILDEPTAVLIPQEVDDLIRRLIDLKKAGKTIIIITHKLNEVKMCADNITVIRAGHVIGTVPNDENTTDEDLAEMMVGRAVLLRVKKSGKPVGGKVAYQVNHLSAVNSEGKKILNDISFRIHENEVVGIAGVEGNGQTELMLALTGLLDVCHGSTVELGGVNITGLWPDELRKHDIGVVPEDRYKQGLCLDVPVSANLIAGYHGLKPYCNKGVMNRRAITENRDRLVEENDVRLSTKDPAVGSLSGGNAQKVIIAREFSRRPKVLLVSQPTRGVDIGAIEFIHNQILKMRDASTAVLIISSELSEVTGLSDRVLVMYHGEIVGSFRSDDVSFNELGLYMSGVKRMSSEELSEE